MSRVIEDTTAVHDLDTQAEEGRHANCVLVMIYGEFIGRRFPLESDPIVIGRSSMCEISLNDDGISRNHCRLIPGDDVVMLVDLESTNGTYVNDTAVSARPLRDGDRIKAGSTIFKFLSSGNIEQSYHEEIYRLKTTDGLTGAYNKMYFDMELEREVSRFERYKRPMALALLDLDHFKKTNDNHGHLAGDAVLSRFVALVKSAIRGEDTFARYGGEEFALFMPEIDLAGAVHLADRIRALVEKTQFTFEEARIAVTVSIGVAVYDESTVNIGGFVREADVRLYDAKNDGRNLVRPKI